MTVLSPCLRGLGALLAVPAAAITLGRIVQGEGSGPRGHLALLLASFAPVALVLWALSALAVGSGLLIAARRGAARRGRRAWAAVLALALAATGLHAVWLAPQLRGEAPEGETRLTVMSLNLLKGRADAEQVAALVAEHDVDVLALQEVTGASMRRLGAAGLDELLPERAGTVRDDGSGTEGTVLLSRWPLEQEAGPRLTFEVAVASVQAPGGAVRVVAAHPAPPLGMPVEAADDHAALRGLLRERPVDVLVGDLNATPDHRALHRYADLGHRSAAEVAGAGWSPTWPTTGRWQGIPTPALLQLDHALVSSRWSVHRFGTQVVAGTDHAALLVELGVRLD